VVVVLSILVAFALDAWWDSRGEREELELDLVSVLEEVSATRARVASRVVAYEQIVRGTEALLEVMDANGEAPAVVIRDTIAFLATSLPTVNPRMSALGGFIASGRLASVEDRELQARLRELPGQLEDAIRELERQRDVFFSVHQVELGRDFDMAPIVRLVTTVSLPNSEPMPTYADVRYPNRILVRNHTRDRLFSVLQTLDSFQRLASDLVGTEDMLSAHLNRSHPS
jgi:hypothetical protein